MSCTWSRYAFNGAGIPQLGSYFELCLLAHHIILSGRAAYDAAIVSPEQALQKALPTLRRALPQDVAATATASTSTAVTEKVVTGACTINRPLITMHDWDLPTY